MKKYIKKTLQKLDQLSLNQIEKIIVDLDSENGMLRSVLDDFSDGIVLVTESWRILYINTAGTVHLPLEKRRHYVGVNLEAVLTDRTVTRGLRKLQSGGDESFQFDLPWGSGVRNITVTMKEKSICSENCVVIVTHDETEANRQAARLHQSEYLASMTTMAASIAHEIKNPLGAISIHLQLMRRELTKRGSITKEDSAKYLDVVDEEIGRLNSIVVDFLFAVRPMNSTLKLRNPEQLIEEIAHFVSPEMEEKGIKFSWHSDCPVKRVMMDEKLIRQVVLNLLNNACNAIGPDGEISISLALDGDMVALSVTDNGKGMEPEVLSKIFEPYFTTRSTGTGLGLTIVYKVMKEHRGEVKVASKPGQGTCFTLLFPVPESERLTLEKPSVAIDAQWS